MAREAVREGAAHEEAEAPIDGAREGEAVSPRVHIAHRDRLTARPEVREPSPERRAASRSPSGFSNRSPSRGTERRPFSPSPTARRAVLRPGPGADQGRKGMTRQGKGKQGKQGKKGKKGKERRVHFEDDDRREW